jgi:hypothetical protein
LVAQFHSHSTELRPHINAIANDRFVVVTFAEFAADFIGGADEGKATNPDQGAGIGPRFRF